MRKKNSKYLKMKNTYKYIVSQEDKRKIIRIKIKHKIKTTDYERF